MLEAAIEAGADDVASGEEEHEVITSVAALSEAQKALEGKFGEPRKASIVWRPQNTIAVNDEAGEKILRLIGALEDAKRRPDRDRELRGLRGATREDGGLAPPFERRFRHRARQTPQRRPHGPHQQCQPGAKPYRGP